MLQYVHGQIDANLYFTHSGQSNRFSIVLTSAVAPPLTIPNNCPQSVFLSLSVFLGIGEHVANSPSSHVTAVVFGNETLAHPSPVTWVRRGSSASLIEVLTRINFKLTRAIFFYLHGNWSYRRMKGRQA